MTDVITFSIPGRAPAAMSGNSRVHWREKHAVSAEYGESTWIAIMAMEASGGPLIRLDEEPWQRAHVTVTQKAVRLRDGDNFLASFKPGLDAIVRAGIIADDKPSCVEIITVKHVKVKHESEEEVVVRIERLLQ